MSRERLYLFDTTLRDGAQTNGVDFSLDDKMPIASCSTISASTMSRAAIPAPTRPTPTSSPPIRSSRPRLHRLRHDRRPGRSASNDPGLAALLDAKADAICFVAKSCDYHVRRGARDDERGKPRFHPRQRRRRRRRGQGGAGRLRALLRRLQGESRLRARLRQGRLRGRRALGGPVRHQWRHAAARGRAHRRRGGQARAGRASRHPCPRRYRTGGREFARRGARRRAPDSGHAQRHRRALRQRQSVLDHPDAEAEERFADRFEIGVTAEKLADAGARVARARRHAQPRTEPACALCRRQRLRDQDRHPCLGPR